MSNCKSLQRSLAWCQGTPVLPGIRRRVYYTHKQNISAWPTLVKDKDTGNTNSSAYSGDFVLLADTYWNYIDVLPDKSQLTSESQGEVPSQTQLNKLSVVHPGVGEEATNAALYLNNSDCVFLVETMEGNYRVVGSDKWQTTCKVSQDLGQGATGTASTTIEAEATDICPAPFYTGEIVTEDGTINSDTVENVVVGS